MRPLWRQHLLFIMIVIVLSDAARVFNFKPGLDYNYEVQTATHMTNVGKMNAKAKVGFQWIRETESGSHEIYIRVKSYSMTYKSHTVSDDEMDVEFDNWFSFIMDDNGDVLRVIYPEHDDMKSVNIKKGLAGIIATRLHHEDFKFPSGSSSWSFNSTERDHTGHHHANYTVYQNEHGDIQIRKKRTAHVHPKKIHFYHNKEVNIKSGMTVPHLIQINEEVPLGGRDPSEGAGTKHFEPINKPKHINDEQESLPDMSVYADSQMRFLSSISMSTPQRPDNLIEDTIEVKKGFDFHDQPYVEEEVMQHIKGNLTCLRELTLDKLSNKNNICYGGLTLALETLPYKLVKDIGDQYFNRPLSNNRDVIDRNYLLDAIAGIRTNYNQELLTELVLNSRAPDVKLMIRFLEHIPFFQNIKSQKMIDAVEKLAITKSKYKGSPEAVRLRELATFIIGAIAKILQDEGRNDEAEKIVKKLHTKVGIFDPWHHRQRRSTMSRDTLDRYERDVVILIGALGNAAHPTSADCILSFANSTEAPKHFQESGLYALRHFHTQQAADALVNAWRTEENRSYKQTFKKLCKENPAAYNLAIMTEPSFNDVEVETDQSYNQTAPIHNRDRRSIRNSYNLLIPRLDHQTEDSVGDSFIGANYGGISSSLLNINSDPQATTATNDFSLEGSFGFLLRMFSPFENFRATYQESHLHLKSSYNMNVLKDYGVNVLPNAVKRLDVLLASLIPELRDAVNAVISDLNLGVDEAVQTLVDRYSELLADITSMTVADLLDELEIIHLEMVPPEIKSAVYLVRSGDQLIADTRADIIEFLEGFMGDLLAGLPWDVEQIYKTVKSMKNIINKFHDDPKEAIADLLKMFDKTDQALKHFTGTKERIESKLTNLKGLSPTWFKDIRQVVEEKRMLIGDIDEILQNSKLENWALENIQQREIVALVRDTLAKLNETLSKLKDISSPFKLSLDIVKSRVGKLNETVVNVLKKVVDKARFEIEDIFGVRFHKKFPRVFLEGSEICPEGGFYPTTNSQRYSDMGIDLIIESNKQVVAPLSGILTVLSDEKVKIEITGGSLTDTILTIDNINPLQQYSDGPVQVYTGDVIGTASVSNCQPNNYIHVVMKKQSGTGTEYIDPSPLMEKSELKCPTFDFERNINIVKYKIKNVLSTPASFASTIGLPEPTAAGPQFNSNSFNDIPMCSVMEAISLLNDDELKQKVIDTFTAFKDEISGFKSFLPNSLTDDYVRTLLQERSLSIEGSREELMARFGQPDDMCPLLLVAVQRSSYCRFEQICLGVECQIPIKLKSNVYPLKVFVRYLPDTEELQVGIGEHIIKTTFLDPVEISNEVVVLEGGWRKRNQELIVRYTAVLQNGELYFDMKSHLCSASDDNDCEPLNDIFTDMLIPIPYHNSYGTFAWRDINIKKYFSRSAMQRIFDVSEIPEDGVVDYIKDHVVRYWKNLLDSGIEVINGELNVDVKMKQLMTFENSTERKPKGERSTRRTKGPFKLEKVDDLYDDCPATQEMFAAIVPDTSILPRSINGDLRAVGGGLTEHGVKAFLVKIMNMTIQDFEATVDLHNTPSNKLQDVMKSMVEKYKFELIRKIDDTVQEVRETLTEIKHKYKVVKGTILFIRLFFNLLWYLILGGIMPMSFGK
ncbi:uncharacterized protein LOC117120523 [Anneissia japonica]|uniref:uncharacterized protein LOC117120523 n=1 Tax=Anneissia japonica TaxID=1529436 RepID=UPI00142599C9|nr:uncharacterized protein LOC117120523 [Anneissia japonica]